MAIRPFIHMSVIALALSVAIPGPSALAEGGLMDRIFNKSDEQTQSQPLYLNQKGMKSSSSNPAPYNYAAAHARPSNTDADKEWAAFDAKRKAEAAAQNERALAAGRQAIADVDQALAVAREERARADAAASVPNTAGKKMVYDPRKSWSIYNVIPTTRHNADNPEKDTGSRIYNRR